MNKLHKNWFKCSLFFGYFGASLVVLIVILCNAEILALNNWFVRSFNFIRNIESSGFLIFAGIAAGVTFIKHTLIFYKNVAFVTGFTFAVLQALIAASERIEFADYISMWLVYSVLMLGGGFIIFSILAMAAYEYEMKIKQENDSKSGDKEASSNDVYINLNLSMKSDSVQPFLALSDLTHDLRYSRSRGRRSPEQR